MATLTLPKISSELVQASQLKIEELTRTKESFEKRYRDITATNDANYDTLQRVTALLDQIKTFDPYLEKQDDLLIISRYLEQAKDDRSVSQAKLKKFEEQLLNKIATHQNCLDISWLHAELLKEAIDARPSSTSVAAKLEKVSLEDEFEMVEQELDEEHEKFEKNTFSSSQINVEEFEKYLATLFEDAACQQALDILREDIELFGDCFISGAREMNDEDVEWCIRDLLERRSLSDEHITKLQGFLSSPAALRELRSTLNMKSVRHWNWNNAERGLPVTARLNSDGRYRIVIDEDILDVIFLHTLAIGWSTKLKEYLTNMASTINVWRRNSMPTLDYLSKREYYLMRPRAGRKPIQQTVCTMCHPAPIPQPPPMIMSGPPPPPPPPQAYYLPPSRTNMGYKPKKKAKTQRFPLYGGSLSDEQHRFYMQEFFLARLPRREGSLPEVTSTNETQAQLLKHLATEARIRHALDGELHGISVSFESFPESLPHQTILTALKFIGFSQGWLDVFTRFLQAPLNMGPLVRGASDRVLNRTAGVPENHGMELFMGELLLFFFDFAVNQKTGRSLYRLGHRGYFTGTQKQVNEARSCILEIGKTMGLNVLCTSLSDGPIGFLKVCAEKDTAVTLTIQNGLVDEYAQRVKKQLGACTTVFHWIQVWNATMGTYAAHLFGPLANVFGSSHLEAVTQAYNRMNEIIFGDSNLTEYCNQLLTSHLGSKLTLPPLSLEAFIYLPTAYGGLGVKNPYIKLNISREMNEHPHSNMQSYINAEKEYYQAAKAAFENKKQDVRERQIVTIFGENKESIAAAFGPDGQNTFFTFEEMIKHRETLCYPACPQPFLKTILVPNLVAIFNTMLEEPTDHIDCNEQVLDKLRDLCGTNRMKRWFNLCGEDRWVLQMYSEECFERYDSLEMWNRQSVPLEVLDLIRGDDDDDGSDDYSSVSDMTEA